MHHQPHSQAERDADHLHKSRSRNAAWDLAAGLTSQTCAPATSPAGAPRPHRETRSKTRDGGRRMSAPDTSRDIPQALWAERGVIVVAPAAQPEPEGEPEAGS